MDAEGVRYHRLTLLFCLARDGGNGYITRMPIDPDRMTRKLVSLPNDALRAIEDFRFQQRIKTESEAIRRLIELGLKASKEPQSC